MPEQLSNPIPRHTRAAVTLRAQRFIRAASLSVMAVAACVPAAAAFAQNAAKPQPASVQAQAVKPKDAKAKPDDAKSKASEAQEKKPAASTTTATTTTTEITRARRAVAPAAATSAAPVAAPSVAPSAAPNAPAVATSVDKPAAAVASKNDAATKAAPKSDEAELERMRAEIESMKPSAERARLERALVDKLVALKRETEALDALRLMIHEDRYDPPFFFNTGNALARLGDASAAEDAYRKAIGQRRGNYARALNNLGVILTRQGHWDEAREALAAALMQENYTYAEASYNLGRLYLLRGEADLAIREWTRTLRLEPSHAEAAAALARTYLEDGNAKRGLAVLDQFTARATRTGASVPLEIADARRELVESVGAKVDDADDDANVKTGAGVGADRGARMSGASPASSNASAREVERATYELLQAARARRESGDYEESVKHYRGVLARSPAGYFPPANLELGAVLINLKRDEEAIAALIPVTERDAARYPVAFYHLGRLYERQGQTERAADSFARAAALYGDDNPQVLIDLSRTREKAGDTTGALDAANAYAAAMKRQGTVPAWVAERQAKLRQKAAASASSPAPKNSTPER
ncbi:MAG TPA: tetratricopeptide repeat protein [Pyrinomonadaceae bacterium]|nr:tetratricopeptide repeat protein [Pyrinomonadaceae bacterium]